jgi:hypothetical protein
MHHIQQKRVHIRELAQAKELGVSILAAEHRWCRDRHDDRNGIAVVAGTIVAAKIPAYC